MKYTEEVISKKSDTSMFIRLLAYLSPYKIVVFFALFTLLLSTASDLLVPVVLQNAIDSYLLPQYVALDHQDQETILDLQEILRIHHRVETKTSGLSLFINLQDGQQLLNDLTIDQDLKDFLQPLDSNPIMVVVDISEPETFQRYNELNLSEFARGVYPIVGIPRERLQSLDQQDRSLLLRSNLEGLLRAGFTLLVLMALSLIFTFSQIFFTAKAGQGVMKDLRLELFGHILHQKMGALQDVPVGTLVSRVTNDVETINELFTTVLTSLIKDVAVMVGVVITLMVLDQRLGLITLATLPPVLILTYFFRLKARAAYRRVRHWVSEVNRYLAEHLSGMIIIHGFSQQERVEQEFGQRNTELLKANISEMNVFTVFRPLVDLLATVSTAVVIYFGAGFYQSNFLTLGILVAFINLIRKFYEPVMDMSEKFTLLQSAMAGSERVFQVLDNDQRIPNHTDQRINIHGIQGAVRFNHVEFSYKDGEPILQDLSFNIVPGQRLAVVGTTGAGKTTLANVLTRLWDIQAGEIFLDGVPISAYHLNDLRSAIMPIQQDISLFSQSIRDNILLGKELPDTKIWEMLEIAQAKDFIQALPDGLDTILSERAVNLSTGQRQLLAFARILAQDPRVIILDEATANIDSETEKRIQKALTAILSGRTSIIIAHRLSTIRDADSIMVLSHGRVVEQGTHEELLLHNGVYSNLYKLQFEHSHSGTSHS
jgi:ATP-binding cassette subfamily B multidrug efflux pump